MPHTKHTHLKDGGLDQRGEAPVREAQVPLEQAHYALGEVDGAGFGGVQKVVGGQAAGDEVQG